MEESCVIANEALLFLIHSIPKDVEGAQKEMREAFCEAQDWIHTLYGTLTSEREKAVEAMKVNETIRKVSFSDKIEHVSEEAPRNEVVYSEKKED
jgi:hypothetical protein